MSSKKRRTYSEDFKKQMVALYEYGKSPSSIYQWRKKFCSTSSDDVTVDNKESIDELRKLREENQKLRMEVDILK